jgi:hypothetical protein
VILQIFSLKRAGISSAPNVKIIVFVSNDIFSVLRAKEDCTQYQLEVALILKALVVSFMFLALNEI